MSETWLVRLLMEADLPPHRQSWYIFLVSLIGPLTSRDDAVGRWSRLLIRQRGEMSDR
jgi:hypothetical protein